MRHMDKKITDSLFIKITRRQPINRFFIYLYLFMESMIPKRRRWIAYAVSRVRSYQV